MTIAQLEMIQKVKQAAISDEAVSAVLMYGSFIKNEGDKYSDIEFYLFCRRPVDHEKWAAGISPLRMFFKNEFGTEVAIFENLIRGEFHFMAVDEIGVIKTWEGLTSFEHFERGFGPFIFVGREIIRRFGNRTEAHSVVKRH